MAPSAKYIYCIIPCQEERTFDTAAIGDPHGVVHTVVYDGLAVVASDSPIANYECTRKNMMAHEKVLERVMQEYTLLPVRFGTVADTASPVENIHRLLRGRCQEFTQILKDMTGKAELGLKAFWRDEKALFEDIVAENPEIKRLRQRLAGKPPEVVRFEGVSLGRMVKEALDRKRGQEAAKLLAPLRPLAERVRENDTLADRMILNASFLVDMSRGVEFDQAVNRLDDEYGNRIGFKYVGPTPPYNFVDITVNWEDFKE
ncbi:MAG: GvpL/GvpF family gas vesicle protein [Dehalococcoidia bacterium]|nr:GvpL/GvpF family gas vesicle protein [Dehalococcoidia bacterium]